ncbi:Ig-like domain-containing protein [Hymenobacter sp. HD11105]
MKQLYSFLSCLSMLILLMPLTSYGQCNNEIAIRYYNNGVLVNTSVTNKGQSGYSGNVCPTAGAGYTFSASSTSNAVLTWSRVISQGARPEQDEVVDIVSEGKVTSSTSVPNELSATVTFTQTTTFRIKSDAGRNKFEGSSNCNPNTVSYVYLTLTPTLSLSSANLAGVCSGSSVELNASGSTDGTYMWSANGVTLSQTGSSITHNPTVTTTYTVTATTSCGTSSQQLTIPVKNVTITPAAPSICAGQSTLLTADYNGDNSGIRYNWTVKGSSSSLSTTRSLTVSPLVTTTYQLVTSTNDCNTITNEVTVTVGATTVSISPTNTTVCSNASTTLTATSNNPNATYSWRATVGSTTTTLSNTTAAITVNPTANTTYTVTASTPCGTANASSTVNVAAAAINTASPTSATVCAGNPVTLTANSNISNATYRWYKTTDLGTVISTNAALTVAPTANSSYRVVITTTCGSTTPSDIPVTVNPTPTVTVTPYNASVRPRSTVTIKAEDGTTGTTNTYAWTATTEGNITTLSETTQSINASPRTATTYTVTVTNPAGCSTSSQSVINPNIPLPVELVSFVATWTSAAPKLTWATASEKNNSYFEIERSVDGSTFQVVGKRLGAGTTLSRTEYQFSDESVFETAGSTLYYRLHQVDITGEDSYSPVRTVQAKGGKNAFKAEAFPNPYDEAVTVQFNALSNGNATLTIHDFFGKIMLTKTLAVTSGAQKVVLPQAASLPAGVYYLTILQGSQQQVIKLSHR